MSTTHVEKGHDYGSDEKPSQEGDVQVRRSSLFVWVEHYWPDNEEDEKESSDHFGQEGLPKNRWSNVIQLGLHTFP